MPVKVAVITSRRADYGIYLPVLRAIQADPALELDLIATADHYWPQTGETVKEILADGFKVTPCWVPYNSQMTKVLADVTLCLTVKWAKAKPDAVLVLGDTGPMLAAATVAAHLNIPVFHIQGGDLTGSIDNKIRYAISAFADYHFPTLTAHAVRLIARGAPVERVRVVGPLGIYAMKDADLIAETYVRTKLGLSDKPVILVIQHPITDEAEQAGEQMYQTLQAVDGFFSYERVIIYPNSDTGSAAMIAEIERSPFKRFKSLPYLTFLSLLKLSKVIVGNSSAGLVEAPLFGVPCVNIGTRQTGRQSGVIIQSDYLSDQVIKSINFALNMYNPYPSPYHTDFDGPAIIVNTLKGIAHETN